MLTRLPDAPDVQPPEPVGGPDHPMRRVTRQVAFEEGWSPGRSAKVAELFDSLAGEWSERNANPVKVAPLRDALARGGLSARGRWLELGSGTGAGTSVLAEHVEPLVAVDLSAAMLARAPDAGHRVRADAAWLPFPADAFDAVVLVNMLLFPAELDRVLRPAGSVVWVNTLGDRTPIHLPPDDVLAALPGDWAGTTANSGMGLWLVAQRR